MVGDSGLTMGLINVCEGNFTISLVKKEVTDFLTRRLNVPI